MAVKVSNFIDKILAQRVLTHVLYWIFVVLVWAIPRSFEAGYEPLINKLCYLPAQLFVSYFLLYYQLPKLLSQKKYLQFLGSIIMSLYLGTVLARIFKIYVYESFLESDLPKDSLLDIFTDPVPLFLQYLLWVVIVPVVTVLFKFIKDHFHTRHRMEELRKEKTTAELNFLKAQIHPHFLFNTLNNLYILTISKSPQAPEVVKTLKDILAYMFEQENRVQVHVREEIQLLRNYIDLEMLRYGERLELIFDQELDTSDTCISPLVLLSIVENAFKHGASGDIGQPKIHIHLQVQKGVLYFSVFNTKPSHPQKDERAYKQGIGVSNIKRQLELLYPNHHELRIEEQERSYQVTLTIDLQGISVLQQDKVYA